jgi:hypothetical protein
MAGLSETSGMGIVVHPSSTEGGCAAGRVGFSDSSQAPRATMPRSAALQFASLLDMDQAIRMPIGGQEEKT